MKVENGTVHRITADKRKKDNEEKFEFEAVFRCEPRDTTEGDFGWKRIGREKWNTQKII